MSITYISDHQAQAVDRLLEQYKQRPNVVALVEALAGRAQAVEDTIQQVASERFLYSQAAQGAQLDDLGALVNLPRNGLDDSTYYVLILGTIAKNYSDGTIDTIVELVRSVYQADAVYASTPNSPAHARLKAYAEINLAVGDAKTDTALTPMILGLLLQSLAGGVTLGFIATFGGQAFACAGPQPWVGGCSDLEGNGGGFLAGLTYLNPLA